MRQVLPQFSKLTLLAWLLLPIHEVAASIWHVPGDAPTIQAGIDLADYGDSVVVGFGSYNEHDIVMKTGVTLTSETGQADCVTIDGQGLGAVILCEDLDETTVITGFTVTGGDGGQLTGGGFHLERSSPRIINCSITGNTAESGGGCSCEDGSPSFIECSISGNSAVTAGGLCCYYSTLVIERCEISDNVANHWVGGGVFIVHASVTMIDCSVNGNRSVYYGGGIVASSSQLELQTTSVIGNEAEAGGGIIAERSDVRLFDSILTGNTAYQIGGGIQLGTEILETLSFEAHYSTIRDNHAPVGANGNNSTQQCFGLLVCCDLDSTGWLGNWIADDDDCNTVTTRTTLSAIKAMY